MRLIKAKAAVNRIFWRILLVLMLQDLSALPPPEYLFRLSLLAGVFNKIFVHTSVRFSCYDDEF